MGTQHHARVCALPDEIALFARRALPGEEVPPPHDGGDGHVAGGAPQN